MRRDREKNADIPGFVTDAVRGGDGPPDGEKTSEPPPVAGTPGRFNEAAAEVAQDLGEHGSRDIQPSKKNSSAVSKQPTNPRGSTGSGHGGDGSVWET